MGNADIYSLYSIDMSSQYLTCIYISVLALVGNDIAPQSLTLSIIASFAAMLGAVISANIYGELAVILSSIGKEEKLF
jgi:hypothetical protein